MKIKWKNQFFYLVPLVISMQAVASASALHTISDEDLSDIHGQSLLTLSYIAPTDAENKMQGQSTGFYKLGMEAEVKLNANIKSLQLGCGGVNGANGCDIDIDNLSFSGISETREGRAGSSAVMTNPFVEFAIKNPDSPSTREMVGLRLSAEKVFGLLTMGDENSDKPNGINSLSGYMKINPTTGMSRTAQRNMTFNDTNQSINGAVNAQICLFFCVNLLKLNFNSTDYNLNLQQAAAPIALEGATISGNRMSSVQLKGVANIDRLNFNGQMVASISTFLGSLDLKKQVEGNITGLKADIKVDQNLGLIHKIPLNNPFSLSLQQQNVWWPRADAQAQRGWWMAFDDSINIGDVTPQKNIDVTNDVLRQVVAPISNYLTNNPVACSALNCLFGSSLAVGNVNLPNTRLDFPLKDLPLLNQNFAPNCYGSLKFC